MLFINKQIYVYFSNINLRLIMKITIVAFDIWGFNKKIAEYLISQGHEVNFIDTSKIKYVYKNKMERIKNFFSKTFLRKNIKKNYLQNYLNIKISNLSSQDCILIINPGYFKNDILSQLRLKTKHFVAYNYDSLKRCPLPDNSDTLFDKIFSFDLEDVKNYPSLELLTNFIYLPQSRNIEPKNKVFMILSDSLEREIILNKIAENLEDKNIENFEFIVLRPSYNQHHKKTIIIKKAMDLDTVVNKMMDAEILVDLIRKDQTGLSFRIFEAMALGKKIITNNATIKQYDFYNPNNILIIDENNIDIPEDFLHSKYQEIDKRIYNKYTIESWTKKILNKEN